MNTNPPTPAPDSTPAMQLQSVTFAYARSAPVVQDVTVNVEPGLIHVILGPNAAGKSTLLKLMLGQLKPDSGRITIDSHRVSRFSAAQRARIISYVPQRSMVGFAFTVRQIVAMGRFALSDDPIATQQALERCDLLPLVDRPYHELSVGQQQRVLLARAMAQASGSGRVMLLDEPVSAMDLSHIHHVMATLTDLARGGLACVVVLHDLNLASLYADRVWLMDQGRLAKCGDWNQVLRAEVLEPVYGVRIDELPRATDPGDPASRRPVFDVRLPNTFDSG